MRGLTSGVVLYLLLREFVCMYVRAICRIKWLNGQISRRHERWQIIAIENQSKISENAEDADC